MNLAYLGMLAMSLIYTFPQSVQAQVPLVRFENSGITVSQRGGTAVIPVIIENSSNIPSYLSVSWTTHEGTAKDRVHFGNNSPYYFGWNNYGGNFKVYPSQSRATITVPVHYTCSTSDRMFSVQITDVTNVYSGGIGAATGVPSTIQVTIQNARGYIVAQKARIKQINRKIKKARRIQNKKVRAREVRRLVAQRSRLNDLICQ